MFLLEGEAVASSIPYLLERMDGIRSLAEILNGFRDATQSFVFEELLWRLNEFGLLEDGDEWPVGSLDSDEEAPVSCFAELKILQYIVRYSLCILSTWEATFDSDTSPLPSEAMSSNLESLNGRREEIPQ